MTSFVLPWKYEQSMRAETKRYVEAVARAHPELAPMIPDENDEPPPYDPYPPLPTLEHAGTWTAPMVVIARQVAAWHRVTVLALRGEGRSRKLVIARQEAFYRCRRELGRSLPQIGNFFGRDHTTVLHGIRAHASRNGLPMPDEAAP